MRRIALALVGLALLVLGLASGPTALALTGLSAESAVGTIGALAGLAALGAALRGTRRRVKVVAIPLALAAAQWLVVPAVNVGLVTHAPRDRPQAPAGVREVSFRAPDGVRIAAWLAPGGRAAVVLLHGSHGSRADVVDHLRMLQRAGFTVLALDSRGHGASGGRTNALGWGVDRDVAGAVTFLERRGFERIGALGLSMGAEAALRAAGEGTHLDAVVADGAGASTSGDERIVPRSAVERSVSWMTMRGIEALSGVREPAPLRTVVRGVRAPVLLIASNRKDELAIDEAYRGRMPRSATVWHLPDTAHTKGLAEHPERYAATVAAFLDRSLSVR